MDGNDLPQRRAGRDLFGHSLLRSGLCHGPGTALFRSILPQGWLSLGHRFLDGSLDVGQQSLCRAWRRDHPSAG